MIALGGPSFEELMMLVFSGPMCFECLDANAEAESEGPESAGEEEAYKQP